MRSALFLLSKKIKVQQSLKVAGRKTPNRLDTSLRIAGFPVSAGRTRLIGPAVYKARRGIEGEMLKMIKSTISTVQKELN
jgi:hypothetical protein